MKYLKLGLSVLSLAVLFSMSVSCSRNRGSDDVFPPYVANTVGDYSVSDCSSPAPPTSPSPAKQIIR